MLSLCLIAPSPSGYGAKGHTHFNNLRLTRQRKEQAGAVFAKLRASCQLTRHRYISFAFYDFGKRFGLVELVW